VLSTFDTIFAMITTALGGIAAISLIVAGVLIMNVMLVAVTQRTKEIGLLKALGAKRGQILLLFIMEAVYLSVFGALLGLIIGNGGTALMRTVYPAVDFAAPVWAMASAVAIAIGSGLVFGILPASRAARLDPVQALAGH
jgi:putative ABC transport system permease protein